MRRLPFAAALLLTAMGCGGAGAPQPERPIEARSLLGKPLYRPLLDATLNQHQQALLDEALQQLAAHPGDPEAILWVGRRLGYLGRYGEAIEIFSRGIEAHPDEPRLYRHRGHRYLTVRRLADAVADFEKAVQLIAGKPDQVEPDGLPNDRGIPTSTLHSNVWYHLGLAFYLEHDFERALDAYRHCMQVSENPDQLVATSHWLYMTLRRLDRDAAAVLVPIRAGMDVIENHAYHQLLLMYRGERDPETLLAEARGQGAGSLATTGYGVGNWYLYNGRRARALEIFREIVATDAWASFGYVAAEAELAHLDD
jgi:tetratricopeptide (TPR) repeat protein